MSLMFKRLPTGKAVMMMCPWLPLELIDNVSAKLFVQDILSVFQPREKIIGHYNNTVIEVEKDMLMNDTEMENYDEESDYEEDQEEQEELQELRKYLH